MASSRRRRTIFIPSRFFLLIALWIPPWASPTERVAGAEDPLAYPTFHSIGLYWSPSSASVVYPTASVQYRKTGDSEWSDALPMRYNPVAGTMEEDLIPYRGSIVSLTPNTEYEIHLSLDGASETTSLTARTWSENFPIGTVVRVASRSTPLNITQSGTPDAYRLYDGTGATIDVLHLNNNCITVNAQYVIIRGFTLKGAGNYGTGGSGTGNAILIQAGHAIVIENCDISDWGRANPNPIVENHGRDLESAVYSSNQDVSQVIVQRCRIHHPTFDTNSWDEMPTNYHPTGPQAVTFLNSSGHHVIRYNEFYSDADHVFNDILGGETNGSYRGYPGPDSDIYCNYLSHSYDNPIEVEGSDRNVRVWNNYITVSYTPIGDAPVSIGPLYVWRNVSNRSETSPGSEAGRFAKMGSAGSDTWMTGRQYFFHNTIFQEDLMGCGDGIGGPQRSMRLTMTRNNILHLRDSSGGSLSSRPLGSGNSFDYDLFNGYVPPGHEAHGIRGVPVYVPQAGFNFTLMKGCFALAPSSPGYDDGQVIPNFNDGYIGAKPDMGAHEAGQAALQVGVRAVYRPGLPGAPASADPSVFLYQ